jgi:sterol desaturase/sphingolipid hydroxylase (fatty acid hydroxylase superfamily)
VLLISLTDIRTYFETIPDLHRTLILWGGLIFFYLIEYAIPLFRFQYGKFKHAGVNIFFTATTIVVNFSLAFILLKASDYVTAHNFGLLNLTTMPLWLFLLSGLLLMDLIGAYTVHFVEHKVKWMWKFHLIHHADLYVDTTTANRHHPGESVFRFVFTTLAVIIIGAPMWIVMLYQSMSVVLSQFNHANIRLPEWLDNIIGWVFISPNMHKVHHHYVQPYTDSNYGNIFSFWDRIFGTYKRLSPDAITYGIDTHMAAQENSRIGNLLKIPFQQYRPPVGGKFYPQDPEN